MKTYLETKEKSKCCGCSGCEAVCPKSAVIMAEDEKGFRYPEIDQKKCIHCNACTRFCDFSFVDMKPLSELKSFVCRLNDTNEIYESSSGGLFTAVSDYVLKNSGVVYGAVLGSDFTVEIKSACSTDERNKMRRTKYVQSRLKSSVYKEIRKNLNDSKTVLFTGTPCQCAAIKKYTGEHKNLILMDFICHVVPSPKVFKEYIDYIEKLSENKIVNYYFRSKEFGNKHSQHAEAYSENGGVYYMMPSADIYYKSFLGNYISRDSCYACPYTSTSRVSDITMGDAWGSTAEEMDSSHGISTLLVNTSKGLQTIELVKESITIKPVDIHNRLQPQLKHPAKKPEKYDQWWKMYNKRGLKGVKKIVFSYKQRVLNFYMEHKIKKFNHFGSPQKTKELLRRMWK